MLRGADEIRALQQTMVELQVACLQQVALLTS
jgi:hypothetical protein